MQPIKVAKRSSTPGDRGLVLRSESSCEACAWARGAQHVVHAAVRAVANGKCAARPLLAPQRLRGRSTRWGTAAPLACLAAGAARSGALGLSQRSAVKHWTTRAVAACTLGRAAATWQVSAPQPHAGHGPSFCLGPAELALRCGSMIRLPATPSLSDSTARALLLATVAASSALLSASPAFAAEGASALPQPRYLSNRPPPRPQSPPPPPKTSSPDSSRCARALRRGIARSCACSAP